jgi:hypothetical protein
MRPSLLQILIPLQVSPMTSMSPRRQKVTQMRPKLHQATLTPLSCHRKLKRKRPHGAVRKAPKHLNCSSLLHLVRNINNPLRPFLRNLFARRVKVDEILSEDIIIVYVLSMWSYINWYSSVRLA